MRRGWVKLVSRVLGRENRFFPFRNCNFMKTYGNDSQRHLEQQLQIFHSHVLPLAASASCRERSKHETTSKKKLKTTEKFSSFSAHVPLGALKSGNLIKWATEEEDFFTSIIHFGARDKNSISCSTSVWLLLLDMRSTRSLIRLPQMILRIFKLHFRENDFNKNSQGEVDLMHTKTSTRKKLPFSPPFFFVVIK